MASEKSMTSPPLLPNVRVGFGYDVHRLVTDRALILGGVEIPYKLGLAGHSDADVLTHAIMDALLGAAGKGDIGGLFPDTDPLYKDISSLKLLSQVADIIRDASWVISNIDITLVAQAPKIAPYIGKMKTRIAAVCNLSISQVNIKATTTEGLGFVGVGEGIAAYAVCLLMEDIPDAG